ncbi:hypothetical protein LA080_012445 [Diaporthe eres]|nr:hypothetical protein LA080_012445 [Diaporthe eres]
MGRIDFARARKSVVTSSVIRTGAVRQGHEVKVEEEEEEEEEGDEVENEGNQWKRQEEEEEEAVGGFNVQAVRINQDSGL